MDCARMRTGRGHGRGADADCLWTGRGRGLDTAADDWPDYGADIRRPSRDYFADAESFAGEGVGRPPFNSTRIEWKQTQFCA
jgi:hypothetical protein